MNLSESYKKRLLELADLSVYSCENFKITEDMIKEVEPYKNSEQFLRSGGFSIEALDRAAFGFTSEDLTTITPDKLHIKWKDDMLNPPEKQRVSGLNKIEWAKKMDFSEPIEVSYQKDKFWLEDGHHRYYAAKILNVPLKMTLEIKENPIIKLGNGLSYDDYHRKVFDCIKKSN